MVQSFLSTFILHFWCFDRKVSDPAIYCSKAGRSTLIASYGHQVIQKLKDACADCLLRFENGLGERWSRESDSAKQEFKEKNLGSVD